MINDKGVSLSLNWNYFFLEKQRFCKSKTTAYDGHLVSRHHNYSPKKPRL